MSKRAPFLLIKQIIIGNLSRKLIQGSTNPTADHEQKFSKTSSLMYFSRILQAIISRTHMNLKYPKPSRDETGWQQLQQLWKAWCFQAVPWWISGWLWSCLGSVSGGLCWHLVCAPWQCRHILWAVSSVWGWREKVHFVGNKQWTTHKCSVTATWDTRGCSKGAVQVWKELLV